MQILFDLLMALIFYSYVGYALLLIILVYAKKIFVKKKLIETDIYPDVTLVIPAYNELPWIDSKMYNTFQIDYPKDKLKIIWITDGSDDGSEEYLQRKYVDTLQDWNIKVYHQPERKGKSAAINRVMNFVDTEIVIFCDANTLLNSGCIKNIVPHFARPDVGCVAGEKRVLKDNTTAGEGESFYWKYESFVKKLNSELYSCIGAVGELVAFRKSLFKPIPEDTILDDFVISMQIAHKGYKIVYEPNAYAEESPSANEKEEMKRKVRIASGAFQCLFRYPEWLNVCRHFTLSFQYFSHKVSRWIIVPLALPLVFVLNIFLFFEYPDNVFYSALLFLQMCFYGIVIIQHYAQLPSKLFRIPYYVMLMNAAMYAGFWRYITKQQSAAWEKVKRRG
ncbi:MAG: glycosyltransferase family 2 protein [Bacteroidia bacterium]